MKKNIYMLAVAAVMMLLNSCAASWLEQEPQGSSMTQRQYEEKDDVLSGSVLGIYSMMYQYGGDHDVFGYRSIDMYGDFTCGDMGMSSFSYGWFQTDEMGHSYQRRAYLWAYYYDIIRLCNKAMNVAEKEVGKGYHTDDEVKANPTIFQCIAQILAMRGWAYANLQKWFCYTPDQIMAAGYTMDDMMSIPIYTQEVTEDDSSLGNPLSSAADVYRRAEEDLTDAIRYFDIIEPMGYIRTIKQEMNADVARVVLAYSYLNKGDYDMAAKYAEEFIDNTNATILPQNDVLTTGFANIDSKNWIWGQDVTVETTTSLASFFGQVDVFSYSYAWAGDVKGIDANLYKDITDKHAWDIRKNWWNNLYDNKRGYQYAPDGKFYSPSIKQQVGYTRAPKSTEIDRDWLCDAVFMRAEVAYLIAAEAECRLGNNFKSTRYLRAITDERQNGSGDYNAWKATLADNDVLLEEIRYNWRVELWGEGYGLQTFRRFGLQVKLGENHKRSNKDLNPNDPSQARQYTFQIPTGELYYNPYLRDAENMAVDDDEEI